MAYLKASALLDRSSLALCSPVTGRSWIRPSLHAYDGSSTSREDRQRRSVSSVLHIDQTFFYPHNSNDEKSVLHSPSSLMKLTEHYKSFSHVLQLGLTVCASNIS